MDYSLIGDKINPSANRAEQTYRDALYTFMASVEGINENAYIVGGEITIGLGFNISSNYDLRHLVYEALGVSADTSTVQALDSVIVGKGKYDSDLTKLNDIMHQWAKSHGKQNPDTFNFTIDTDIIKTIFYLSQGFFEAKIDDFCAAYGIDIIPNSNERIALFSLAYNQKNDNPLLGEKLGEAIALEDRAEAWCQIRYYSNGEQTNNTAKRRFLESTLFGVDDPKLGLNADDSILFESMYKNNKSKIDGYESIYQAALTEAQGISKRYALQLNVEKFTSIKKYEDYYLLYNYAVPTADIINGILTTVSNSFSRYAPSGTINNQSPYALIPDIYANILLPLTQTGYSSISQIALGTSNTATTVTNSNTLILSDPNVWADRLIGGAGNDVIVPGPAIDTVNGGAGFDTVVFDPDSPGVSASLYSYQNVEGLVGTNSSDTLSGDAKNNFIYGRSGNDLIFGGAGDDLLVSGDGNSQLYGGNGNDLLVEGLTRSLPPQLPQRLLSLLVVGL